MAQNEMIQLQPVFKDYIWGGTKIRDFFRKNTGNLDRIAESWEFSSHVEGQSRIASGEYAGKTLSEFFAAVGWSKVGGFGRENRNLPCMVKFIDACENLSIQVHPTDNYAIRHERDNGKNEMWYIMSAEEGAFIYVGFNKNTSRKEVLRRIQDHSIEEILNKVPVRKGDSFFIPAGTVHAIGAGCFICEIQQTSNVTYRLYDYDRRDRDGRLRPLQIKRRWRCLTIITCKYCRMSRAGCTISGLRPARCSPAPTGSPSPSTMWTAICRSPSCAHPILCTRRSSSWTEREMLSCRTGRSISKRAIPGC